MPRSLWVYAILRGHPKHSISTFRQTLKRFAKLAASEASMPDLDPMRFFLSARIIAMQMEETAGIREPRLQAPYQTFGTSLYLTLRTIGMAIECASYYRNGNRRRGRHKGPPRIQDQCD
jgi:hypothetical protein